MTEPAVNSNEDRYAGAATGEEGRFFAALPQTLPVKPDVVRTVEYRFGLDSDGSPAVWITIVAKDELNPSKKTVDEISQYSKEIRAAVIASGFGRWPYVDVRTE